jgi:hypothetical protein
MLIGTGGGTTWYPFNGVLGTTTYHKDGVLDTAGRSAPMAAWSILSLSITIPWTFQFSLGLDRVYTPRYWHGDIAEVIAYDRVLATNERQEVEQYLRDKWGL